MAILTKFVALGNIVGTILRGNQMQESWHIFRGNQTAIHASREALVEEFGDNATIVLGGRDYFYAKLDPKYFDDVVEISKASKVSWNYCTEPEYATAYCGKLSAAVAKHQYACHACKDIKKKNTAWSEETLENEIAKTAPVVEDAATMLTSFMDIATTHRDEHLAFAAKWDGYLIAFKNLHTESQASLRLLEEAQKQLDEAQLRYNVTTFRVEQLLQTGDDD